jgi:hypothetical protein
MKSRTWAVLGLGLAVAAPSIGLRDAHRHGETVLTWSIATPAEAADDITFSDIEVALGAAKIKIPEIKVSGSSLSKEELQGIVNGPWNLATADKLSHFDADSVEIPEIDVDITTPGVGKGEPVSQHAVYRDLSLEDIQNGKIATITAEGMTTEVKGPAPMTMTLGAFKSSGYDLVAAVRFVFAGAQPGEQAKQLVGPSTFESMDLKAPEGVEIKTGKIETGAIKAKPLATPIATLIPTLMEAGKSGKPMGDAEAMKMMGTMKEFYEAFSVDGMSVSDVSVTSANPMFQGASLKAFKVGTIADARYSEFGFEGLKVEAAGGHVNLDRLALLGIDIKPMLEAMATAAKSGPEGMKHLDWRAAIPHLDGLVVKGVDVSSPMMPGDSHSFKLANYELKLANYVAGIPTVVRSQLDDLAGDTALLEEKARQLEALGYKHVDLSSLIDIAWNEGTKAIAVNEISAKGADMGLVSIKGMLGNAARDLFAGSPQEMQAAGLGVTLQSVNFHLENGGLLDRVATQMAAMQHTTPDKLRAQWGAQAALGIPQVLGGSDQAKELGQAIATFIANPKSLTISAKAKKPTGVGFMDVMGNPNPSKVFDLLDVSASANQ